MKYSTLFQDDPQYCVFPEETIPELVARLGGSCEGPESETIQRWYVYFPNRGAIDICRSSLAGRDCDLFIKDEDANYVEILER